MADKLYGLQQSVLTFGGPDLLEEAQTTSEDATVSALIEKFNELHKDLDPHLWAMLQGWRKEEARYSGRILRLSGQGKGDQRSKPHPKPESDPHSQSGSA